MDKLIVKIQGGLGNQMFQYAAGLALALESGRELQIDKSWYSPDVAAAVDTHRQYELDLFPNIKASFADPVYCRSLKVASPVGRIRRRLSRWFPLPPLRTHALEQGFLYKPQISRLYKGFDCYWEGYWQSELYFKDYADRIRHEFAFPNITDDQNRNFAELIAGAGNAVSVHVRLGDYISNPHAASYHGGICNPEYYRQALAIVQEKVPDAHLVVFSDEPEKVRQHIPLPDNVTFVNCNHGRDSFRDIQLMTMCRHHILANSSFSWWGAWLNRRDDKIVVAPRKWFNAPIDTSTLHPDGWIKL